MASQVESDDTDSKTHEEANKPQIMIHELSDRYVFTETENTDGWIASDVTTSVDP
ncbi:hypothetical protein ACYJ1Y_03575 [Natrialbaceae archaeon A-gly3]